MLSADSSQSHDTLRCRHSLLHPVDPSHLLAPNTPTTSIFPSSYISQVHPSKLHSTARYKPSKMFRQSIARPLTSANRFVGNRSFSALAPRMGEGDTGAPKTGGAASSYVFLFFVLMGYSTVLISFAAMSSMDRQTREESR